VQHHGGAGAAHALGRAASSPHPSLRSVERFVMLGSGAGALLGARWLVLSIPRHQAFQLVQQVEIIVELHLPELPVAVPGVLVDITEAVHVLGIQSYQGASQALGQEGSDTSTSRTHILQVILGNNIIQLCYLVHSSDPVPVASTVPSIITPAQSGFIPNMAGILQPSINFSSQCLHSTLPNRDMRTTPGPDGEPHDLPLGEDEEHDEGLHTHSYDDHHCHSTQLLRWRGWLYAQGILSNRINNVFSTWSHCEVV